MAACGFFIYRRTIRRSFESFAEDPLTGAGRFRVTATGESIEISAPGVEKRFGWHLLDNIERKSDCTVLHLGTQTVFPVPDDAFESAAARTSYVDALSAFRAAANVSGESSVPITQDETAYAVAVQAATESVADSAPAPARVPARMEDREPTGFARNLRAGLRAALLLPVEERDITPSLPQAMLCVVLILLTRFAFDFARTGLNGQFGWFTLPNTLLIVPVLAGAACLLAGRLGDASRLMSLLTALAGAALLTSVGNEVVRTVLQFTWTGGMTHMRWQIAAWIWPVWLAVALVVLSGRWGWLDRVSGVLASAGATALIAGMGWMSMYGSALWFPRSDDEAQARTEAFAAAAAEDVIYAQSRLLGRAVAALEPGRKDAPNLYFIGMAGHAPQDVFMKEVVAAEKLFQERFRATGRTLKLINNAKTLADSPVASVTALQTALDGVAKAMDKDKDILFLFLTSHGSRDFKFGLDLWPWQFNELDPKRLRALIDASEVKWKVVVVSACYSGGFIEALKSPTTLVITASAPDKNSFGCSNEAEFTYFGKAYIDQALRRTTSFTEAFTLAQAEVARREQAEKHTPSEPQIALGSDIAAKLKEFEAALRMPAATPGLAAAASAGSSSQVAEPQEVFQRLARQIWTKSMFDNEYRLCMEHQTFFGPAARVKADPDQFSGIRPGSPLWSGIVAAHDRYYAKVCADRSADELWRDYASLLSRNMAEIEANSALAHLQSGGGVRFREAVVTAEIEFAKVRNSQQIRTMHAADAELGSAIDAIYGQVAKQRAPVGKENR